MEKKKRTYSLARKGNKKLKFMKSIIGKILLILLIIVAVVFILRFVIGGPEDDWICVDGQWVKPGVPLAPQPTEPCD